MTGYGTAEIWTVIAGLGLGTYLVRVSFLGLIGNRPLPEWILRHLRYTPVALIPGLVAPLVLFPEATGGTPDPLRLAAAAVSLVAGYAWKSVLLAICGGAGVMALGIALGLG